MIADSNTSKVNYITKPKAEFEDLYIEVRDKEQRVLSDKEVKQLPKIASTHPHFSEWSKRQISLTKIEKHLAKHNFNSALEIGCGNGWFSNKIANVIEEVDGLDVGEHELEQAVRCFGNKNIHFLCCSDLNLLKNEKYDLLIFNASIQYFDVNQSFWNLILSLLKPEGSVLIMDTPIYSEKESLAAKKRTEEYFKKLETKSAANYYFHLTWNQLPKHEIIYKPSRILSKFINQSPFPIIQINKES